MDIIPPWEPSLPFTWQQPETNVMEPDAYGTAIYTAMLDPLPRTIVARASSHTKAECAAS